MATKNIEININNGNGYDILYPKTVVANIGDLSSNYYNKIEINNLLNNVNKDLVYVEGDRKGTGTTSKPSYNQTLFSIETGVDLILFFYSQSYKMQFNSRGFLSNENATGGIYSSYSHWGFSCKKGIVDDTLIFIAERGKGYTLKINKQKTKITFSFLAPLNDYTSNFWDEKLLNKSAYNYFWWGIGYKEN